MKTRSRSGGHTRVLLLWVAWLATVCPVARAYANQPNMETALSELQEARGVLGSVAPGLDGPGAKAIARIDEASTAVRNGIAIADRGGHPETNRVRSVTFAPLPRTYANQAKIEAALRHLKEARAALERATHNHGDYRVTAIELVDQAVATVRDAVALATTPPAASPVPKRAAGEATAPATPRPAASGMLATSPPNWIAELPTVDEVVQRAPKPPNGEDSTIRQAAAVEVLDDLIMVFAGKTSVMELREMPPAAEARYREYHAGVGRVYRGQGMLPVWRLSGSKEFREQALAAIVPPAWQKAYWSVRTKTMADFEARNLAGAKAALARTAVVEQLPSVERVERDMKADGGRNGDARMAAALDSLWFLTWTLEPGNSKGLPYDVAKNRQLKKHPASCAEEPGCDPKVAGGLSRFAWCYSAYERSPEFLRALLDRYAPNAAEMKLEKLGNPVWEKALAMSPGTGSDSVSPSLACTTTDQFVRGDDQRWAAANAARPARAHVSPSAEVVKDLELAQQAKPLVSTTVFGVALGKTLDLPLCSLRHGDGLEDALKSYFGLPEPPVEKTCEGNSDFNVGNMLSAFLTVISAVSANGETLTGFRVGRAVRPDWLHPQAMPEAIEKDGVVVGVLMFTMNSSVSKAILDYLRDAYGPPTHPTPAELSRDGGARYFDWSLSGLHVSYGLGDVTAGEVTIELDSYRRFREAHQGVASIDPTGVRPRAVGSSRGRTDESLKSYQEGLDNRVKTEHARDELNRAEIEHRNNPTNDPPAGIHCGDDGCSRQ